MTTFSRQRGTALFIALIGLVAMTLAGIALTRSVTTSNIIAGNLAFRQAALMTTDIGIEAAVSSLPTFITSYKDTYYPSGKSSTGFTYYPVMQTDADDNGVMDNIDWDGSSGVASVSSSNIPSGYEVKYIVERLCSGSVPVTDIARNCYMAQSQGGGTQRVGGIAFTSSATVYYRVTARVTGPRNTVSYVQAVLSR